jgi:hypothetical protein
MIFVTRAAALGVAMLIGSALSAPPAQAGYIVTLTQQGSDVVATGSGGINLTALSFNSLVLVNALIWPSAGAIRNGGPLSGDFIDRYTGFTGPTSFGSGTIKGPDTSSGDLVGIVGGSLDGLDVPTGYSSGSPLADNSTYHNATFSSLGVAPGTYEWTWGVGLPQTASHS